VHLHANVKQPGELFVNLFGTDGASHWFTTAPGCFPQEYSTMLP
jgi:hypothetical protein